MGSIGTGGVGNNAGIFLRGLANMPGAIIRSTHYQSTQARADILRTLVEKEDSKRHAFDRAFVLSQYFGYLRRNPNAPPDNDFSGFDFWLQKLREHKGDFRQAEMVKTFITSAEYRKRFGQ